jgi:GT2 family glycosyltransferase
MKNTLPLVSILIVTYNSENYLKACFNSIKKLKYPRLEVMIVDNASSDSTRKILSRQPKNWTIIYNTKNVGFAAANNQALKKAQGEFILLLNPDTVVTPQLIENCLAGFSSKNIAAVQPAVWLTAAPKLLNLTGKVPHIAGFDWIRDYRSRRLPAAGSLSSLSGCGVMFRRTVVQKLGLFEDFFFAYYEDSDLSFRLRAAGYALHFQPTAQLFHDYRLIPPADDSMQFKFYLAERNRLAMVLKNYELKTVILLTPIFILFELGMLGFSLKQGLLQAKLRSYAQLFQLLPRIFKSRKKLQTTRRVSDAVLLKSFTDTITFQPFLNPLISHIANPVTKWYWRVVRQLL